jgi:hypothetical protein
MNANTLEANLSNLLKAIDLCIQNKLILPGLILMYCTVDTLGWLDTDDPKASVQKRFTGWVDTYLLPMGNFKFTSLELYAARCGLVHTYTPDSELFKNGRVRRISYAWGNANVKDLDEAINVLNFKTDVAVHVSELYNALDSAVRRFQEDVEKESGRARRVYERASQFFDPLPKEMVEEVAKLRRDDVGDV